jgi:eukaryotic-like serine/threonine-protein kinase
MASIFRGTDLRTGRPVAIKIPHPEMESDPVFFDRFRREEEIGRMLDHPGVMKVLPNDDRSQFYMVMEWVDGRLLRQILNEQGKLPAERAVRIALRICEVLEYIHQRGIVHRDLKPDNIMVDDGDHVKLIDFGIAAKSGSRRLTFTKLSQVMGTAEYISPEQVKGKRGDARSDLYALGIMLYEMLTGKTPFSGDNPFLIMNDRVLNNPCRRARSTRAFPLSFRKSSTARWNATPKAATPAPTNSPGTSSIGTRWAWRTAPNCAIGSGGALRGRAEFCSMRCWP